MNKYFLKLSIFIAILLLTSKTGVIPEKLEHKTIKIGVYHNPPKIIIGEDGLPYGFHIDILNAIAESELWDLEFISGTWNECLERLINNEIDILPDLAYSKERELIYDFNKEAVLFNWGVVYCAPDVNISSTLDLDKKIIATLKESIHTTGDQGIINIIKSFGMTAKYIFTESYEEAFQLVDSGKADIAVVNRLYGLENEKKFNVNRTPIVFNPSSLLYGISKNNKQKNYLISRLDHNILKLKEDRNGIYYKSFDKYILKQIQKESKIPYWFKTLLIIIIISLFIALLTAYLLLSDNKYSNNFSNHLKKYKSISSARDNILNTALISFSVFSIPVLLSLAYQSIFTKWNFSLLSIVATSIILLLTAVYRKRINEKYKIVILTTTLFFFGLASLQIWRLVGIGTMFFLTASILITILKGKKFGIVILSAGLLITLLFGILINLNILKIRLMEEADTFSSYSWMISIFTIFMLFFTLVSGLERFYAILLDSVNNLERNIKKRTFQLKKSNLFLKQEINEKNIISKKLRKAKFIADKANKAKSSFLAHMTHEIRTPLNAILGYSQLLQREDDLQEEFKKQIEIINNSGEHLLTLINGILEMSRIEAGKTEMKIETFDFYKVIEDVKSMFKVKTDTKGLKFSAEIDQNVPRHIISDLNKIKQVIINIVGNSIKFTREGNVSINCRIDPLISNKMIVSIKDTGVGIPAGDIKKIFGSFEQSKAGRDEGGTGLGLSISKKFAKLLYGDIEVESELGVGSEFKFTFKFKIGNEEETETRYDTRNVVGIKDSSSEIKVLIVDDRDTNRDILVRMLSKIGFVTKECDNGASAIEYAVEWKPDIMLLDIVMPVMDGKEVIKRIRQLPNGSDYKIIVLTASALEEDKKTVLDLGADSFLRKPFRQNEILEEIKKLTNIEYMFEDKQINENAPIITNEYLKNEMSDLTEDVLRDIKNNILIGDITELKKILNFFDQSKISLSKYLISLIEEYEFERITKIIDAILEE